MKKVRIIASVLEIIIGITLLVCSFANLVDEFWCGFGMSMLIIGAIFLLKNIKYHTNENYREETNIKLNDERNKYLSLKAWSWSGYLFIIISALGTIIFKFMGKEDLMMLCSGAVCLIVLIYWISYIILSKKY